MNISLVESGKDEYFIQFWREKGGIEEYYEKFKKIKKIILSLLN